jgi:DNA-binding MarR family transcriptional regulator
MTTARLSKDFELADDSAGFLLWKITNAWQAKQRAALKPYGLTHVQYVLLATLTHVASQGQSLNQKELAAFAQTDMMMTSQVIRRLEALALLERVTDKNDRRAFRLKPTPRGAKLAKRATIAVESVDRDVFAACGDDFKSFKSVLQRLAFHKE